MAQIKKLKSKAYKNVHKREKTVKRAYGGSLCGKAVRDRYAGLCGDTPRHTPRHATPRHSTRRHDTHSFTLASFPAPPPRTAINTCAHPPLGLPLQDPSRVPYRGAEDREEDRVREEISVVMTLTYIIIVDLCWDMAGQDASDAIAAHCLYLDETGQAGAVASLCY